jgi:aspartyl/asparaginyl beta-hydroxylase (cupin superfamily)
MNQWIPETLVDLERWIIETGMDRRAIQRIIDGLEITARGAIARDFAHQQPTLYFPGLAARPWWDTKTFPWVETLETASTRILREWEQSGEVESGEVENSRRVRGRWSKRYLSCIGRPNRNSTEAFPVTLQVLSAIPGATTASMAFFSAVAGGTHILPHHGFTNAHLRCHLTLVASDRSRIRVGEEIRGWQPGKVLVFDDSFEHEVWNDSNQTRLVLLFDIFHPELDGPEIDALTLVIQNFRKHFMRSCWSAIVATSGEDSDNLTYRL